MRGQSYTNERTELHKREDRATQTRGQSYTNERTELHKREDRATQTRGQSYTNESMHALKLRYQNHHHVAEWVEELQMVASQSSLQQHSREKVALNHGRFVKRSRNAS